MQEFPRGAKKKMYAVASNCVTSFFFMRLAVVPSAFRKGFGG